MILTAEGTEHVQHIADATGIFNATWVMIALPLFGALVLLCGGKRTDAWGHILGCATVFGAFVIGAIQFFTLLGKDSDSRAYNQHLYDWLDTGNLQIGVGFQVDQLSICFVLLITFVGFLIHVY